MKRVGRIHLERNKKSGEIEAMRIYLGKEIANLGIFKHSEQIKTYIYPNEKKIIITEFD